MHRFFVSSRIVNAQEVRLSGDVAHQVSRVLRMREGDRVALFDGSGADYVIELAEVGREVVLGRVVAIEERKAEPSVVVDLYLSLLNKPDKFEWALQKCTELGVNRIVPLASARAVSAAPERGRRERWERIIKEAVEQSGRTRLPLLGDTLPLGGALEAEQARFDSGNHLAVMLAVGAKLSLGRALRQHGNLESVSLFVGPEGGFTEDEFSQAEAHGVLPVTMGPRILRAETAAVSALAVVMFALGEME